MRLPLKLPYAKLPGDANEVQTTAALIRHAVTQKYPQGLPRVELRMWGKIEDALEEGASEIELTLDQWTFVREAIQASTWPVPWARLALLFLDTLEQVEREA